LESPVRGDRSLVWGLSLISGSLGLVQLFISFLEGPLGICIIVWGWLLLLIWNGILNGVGWIGGVLAGCIRRN
jgi:hypothetical protein